MTSPAPGAAAGASADGREVLIELSGYSFQYRAQAVPTLHDIDLVVRRGEKIAIVGASGSGKSTLLAAINGLVPHHHRGTSTGTVRVAGLDPASVPLVETARRVGTVLQDTSGQFVGLTVAEDIAFSLENQQLPHAEMPARVTAAAAAAGIADHLDRAPQDLSGGQKQRVAIAGVLVDEVDVLVFDEPLAMLDPASGRAAIELIDTLHRDRGVTVVIVEHRLEDVLHRDVDRIVLMDAGRIVADCGPDELVASGLLEQHGIRPPLHVAALRYAGAPVTADQAPARAERIDLAEEQVAAVRAWVARAPRRPGAEELPAAPALDLQDVGCVIERPGDEPDVRALEGVSARIRRGEMVGIIGSNGAGKSTLARVICGFERNSEGTVLIDGADAGTWPLAERGEHVGFVLQEPGQMISRPLIAEEIALGLRARGLDAEEIARRTERVLEICGLRPFRSWPVSALSHGQKKRLTIASVLALEPDVLILDEPTAGQDFAHYTEFMDFLRSVNAHGTTVLLITHDMHLALEYTDRVLVVSGGRLLADAHPADVLTDDGITSRADLVTTGLYTLAQRCGLADASALVRRFVDVDRAARAIASPGEAAGVASTAGRSEG
ncbi:ABC transporter ATP-binding protein [Brachybacterium huguangmaarense]|uniref:ABC transporter ATP-binding protein n=1 Tax=Brachybacterium huguangmaarense TaxID=1652028 RepID=A0ABY6G1W5_9MICO|nr:ABC transporter ATP-binding protein [Brachybacterium huguangmaarense]UYG17200.1 ABC transporter ATP-binding protein [Brachybacterium huguangmaarense]